MRGVPEKVPLYFLVMMNSLSLREGSVIRRVYLELFTERAFHLNTKN